MLLDGPAFLVEQWGAKSRDNVTTFGAMLDVLLQLVAKRKAALQSAASDGSDSETNLSSSQRSLSASGCHSLSASDFGHSTFPDEALCSVVAEANAVLRDEAFVIVDDLHIVRFFFRLSNLALCDGDPRIKELALNLQVEADTKMCIDFNYGSGCGLPLVSASILKQSARTVHDVQVCEWLCGIARHVQELFETNRKELRHYGHDSTMIPVAEDTGVLKAVARFVTRKKKLKAGEEDEAKEQAAKSAIGQVCNYMSPGGMHWRSESTVVSPKQAMIQSASEIGFDVLLAAAVIQKMRPVALEELINLLCADTTTMAKITDANRVAFAQLETRVGPVRAADALVAAAWNVELAQSMLDEEVEKSKIQSKAIVDNFFLSFVEFLSERVRHFERFCLACHAPHNCCGRSAVVCPTALCVFRWENFRLQELFASSTLCVFQNCGSTNWALQCVQYFGRSVEQLSVEYGIKAQTVLEMAFHKYLPRDEMMKFLEVIKSLNAKSVVNCCSPALCVRFERKLQSMKEAGRKNDEVKPQVAYHGTSEENVNVIAETGFRLDKLAANTGNKGYYGAGCYVSPQASYCMGYCRGGKTLLVCAVLMGKRHTLKQIQMGAPLEPGHDSHTDPTGNAEWVLFDEAQILPCFKLQFA